MTARGEEPGWPGADSGCSLQGAACWPGRVGGTAGLIAEGVTPGGQIEGAVHQTWLEVAVVPCRASRQLEGQGAQGGKRVVSGGLAV